MGANPASTGVETVKNLMVAAGQMAAALMLVVAMLAASSSAEAAANDKPQGKGIVYLLRGGANIFSTGMDEIVDKLKPLGVDARSTGHASWKDVAAEARERYLEKRQPIIIVGHSFGANAAILVADDLNKHKIPVALVVTFDPTAVMQAPPNVKWFVNFYSSTVQGMNLQVQPSPHFTGKLENIAQPDVGHLELDNDPRLHDKTIGYILKLLGLRNRAAATAASG